MSHTFAPDKTTLADAGLVAYRSDAQTPDRKLFVAKDWTLGPDSPEVEETSDAARALLFGSVNDWERFLDFLEQDDTDLFSEVLGRGYRLAVARVQIDYEALITRD